MAEKSVDTDTNSTKTHENMSNPNPFVAEFAKEVHDNESAKHWFRKNGLFSSNMKCDLCNGDMKLYPTTRNKEKEIWKCTKSSCNGKTTSIRHVNH